MARNFIVEATITLRAVDEEGKEFKRNEIGAAGFSHFFNSMELRQMRRKVYFHAAAKLMALSIDAIARICERLEVEVNQ